MDWNVAGMENIRIIAHIYTDFDEKFGIPRQSGIVKQCRGRIVFEPEYRNEEALAGIDGYSHLWLIWKFSESVRQDWSPTVRPPRLGGNKRVGVFATRSPFRPNPMGLSSVRLEEVITDSTDGRGSPARHAAVYRKGAGGDRTCDRACGGDHGRDVVEEADRGAGAHSS